MKILARIEDAGLRRALEDAASRLDAAIVRSGGASGSAGPDVIVAELGSGARIGELRAEADRTGAALVVAVRGEDEARAAARGGADEWVVVPVDAEQLATRLAVAGRRRAEARQQRSDEAAELLRYQELLYDKLSGFPTLPVMIERARELLNRRGEMTILYINFVWYEKVEEIYGWQKLDDVLETTAAAMRDFCREQTEGESLMMVSHVADDDFILFSQLSATTDQGQSRVRDLSDRLGKAMRRRIEEVHGEDIAALCGIYVGTATIFRDPKIRTERLIYRGIREAAHAARGVERWERTRKIADLKATLREGAVFVEYHPIIVTATEEVYGYEALARGLRRELRSPEVLFEVAEEANLIWELSRLLRRRAVDGIIRDLGANQHLFLNVDPHDFDDPSFRNLDPAEIGIDDPGKVVFEITERTAIKDYPQFQEYLSSFRERGFRFAVDDAGSGFAGLGSIANLAPDYIKLDISLISNIDTNFLKQNLVETMVGFAESQNAQVIAEGVERREEFETVRKLGVHLTQGFLFHKPKYAGKKTA